MTEYLRISAWFNTDEWLRAYNLIYTDPTNLNEAHNLLHIWKARSPFLPSGVESTLILLQVHLQDQNSSDDPASERILRLAYASAVMRFINHMFDSETSKGLSLYNAAKVLGVPDWIVDLRHNTAHGNSLPTLELFREATLIGFQWLRTNYWEQQKIQIQDYVVGHRFVSEGVLQKIEVLMNIFTTLSICAHAKCKIKSLAVIPNPAMKQSIIDDLQFLFKGEINFTNLKSVTIVNVVKKLDDLSKELFYNKDMVTHMNKLLLGKDSLFLSKELINLMGSHDFKRQKSLHNNYVQCFELLLTFLHKNDLLIDIILELLKITKYEDESNDKSLIAALWLEKILGALQKCKQFKEKTEMMETQDMSNKTRIELKSLYHHWFPNENMNDILLLDLMKDVPSKLTDIYFIQPIISEYNPYLTYFIRNLLNLVEPPLPPEAFTKICNLARVISGTVQYDKSPKIYTVDDLISDHIDLTEHMDIDEPTPLPLPLESTDLEGYPNSIWKQASKNYNWRNCPLGQLPWQIISGPTHCGDL